MEIGFRQSFNYMEDVESRFHHNEYPIELALPYVWNLYAPVRGQLHKVEEIVKNGYNKVLSVHAVQAPITDDRFLTWGLETAFFAKRLGAKIVVVHPNNYRKGHKWERESTVWRLKYLQKETNMIFGVETFMSRRRILPPETIMDFNLPMVLDTSHITDDDKLWSILNKYLHNIVEIHLSARVQGMKQHQRIDNLCIDIVKYLVKSKWNGHIILEYLKPFHQYYPEDICKLRRLVNV